MIVKSTRESMPAVWVVGVDGSATADGAVDSVFQYKGERDIVHVVHVRDKEDMNTERFSAFIQRSEKSADAMVWSRGCGSCRGGRYRSIALTAPGPPQGFKFTLLETTPEQGVAGAILSYV